MQCVSSAGMTVRSSGGQCSLQERGHPRKVSWGLLILDLKPRRGACWVGGYPSPSVTGQLGAAGPPNVSAVCARAVISGGLSRAGLGWGSGRVEGL